jgi:hypothetical protein
MGNIKTRYTGVKGNNVPRNKCPGKNYSNLIMFTPARDFLLETPWRIIIPNPNVNSHSL